MISSAVDRYKQVQQNTLTPGELLLALYDGLFRFLNGAKVCFENNQKPRGRELLCKAHAVISELYLALDYKHNPDLCANLASVYDFSMSRITEANRDADPEGITEVLRVLSPLREAWQQAVPEAHKDNANKAKARTTEGR
ncbi:MAG: hypothetical protein RJA70_3853 [Pseudomonadota bacterium]|jgi:flagellar protein FliS